MASKIGMVYSRASTSLVTPDLNSWSKCLGLKPYRNTLLWLSVSRIQSRRQQALPSGSCLQMNLELAENGEEQLLKHTRQLRLSISRLRSMHQHALPFGSCTSMIPTLLFKLTQGGGSGAGLESNVAFLVGLQDPKNFGVRGICPKDACTWR